MADIKLVMQAETAPIDRAIRVLDNLEAELRNVRRAEKQGLIDKERLRQETERLTGSINRLKTVSSGSAKEFLRFEKSVYGSGKAMRQKEIAMQQAGYQLQDFIVQVQSGTNPLIAFSQQGSQLAGFFAGPWGAAIGLGIAALGGLGTALLGVTNKAKDTQQAFEDLGSNVDSFSNFADSAALSADQLSEKFGAFATTVKAAYEALRDIQRMKVSSSIIAVAGEGPLSLEASKAVAGGKYQPHMQKMVREFLNLEGVKPRKAGSLIGEFGGILGQLTKSQGFEQQLEYLNRLNDILKGQFGTDLENALAPQEVLDFYEKVNTAIVEVSTALNAERLAQKAADEAAKKAQEEIFKAAMAASAEQIAQGQRLRDFKKQEYIEAIEAEDRATSAIDRITAKTFASIKAEKRLESDRLKIKSALSARFYELTQQAEKELQAEYDKGIIKRFKGEAALMDQEVQIHQDVKDAIQQRADEAAAALKKVIDDFERTAVLIDVRFQAETDVMQQDFFRGAAPQKRYKYEDLLAMGIPPEQLEAMGYKPTKKPKTPAESMASIIERMEREANLQKQLVGLSEREANYSRILYDLKERNKDASGKMTEGELINSAKRIAQINAETKALEKQEQVFKDIADTISDDLTGAFKDFLKSGLKDFDDFTESIKESFRDLLADMAAKALQKKILIPLTTGLSAGLGSSAAASTMASGTGSFAGGTMGAALAAGASSLGAGASAALGLGGYSSAGLFAVSSNAAVATAAGASPMLATIGAAVPAIAAVAAVVGLLTSKTKLLDSGLEAVVKTNDVVIKSFKKTEQVRLFGLMTSGKKTTSSIVADSPLAGQILQLQAGIMSMADQLGVAADVFDKFSYRFKLSLKGLSEEDKIRKVTEELNKMGDAFASLIPNVENLNQLNQIMSERGQIEVRLLQAQGNTAALRELELLQVNEYNRALLKQVFAVEDAKKAMDDLTNSAQDFATKVEFERAKARGRYGLPIAANSSDMPNFNYNSSSSQPAREQDDNKEQLEAILQALVKIVKNTKDNKTYLRTWDITGLPPERTA